MRQAGVSAPEPRPRTLEEWQAIEEIDPLALTELEGRIASKLRRWEMGGPAILLLESMKPVSWIASQVMAFAQPFTQAVLNAQDVYTMRKLLEDRKRLEELIQRIESEEESRLLRATSCRRLRDGARGRAQRFLAWRRAVQARERGIRGVGAKQRASR